MIEYNGDGSTDDGSLFSLEDIFAECIPYQDGETMEITTAFSLAQAEKKGLEVVYPEPRELQMDLDSPEALDEFYTRLNFCRFVAFPGMHFEMTKKTKSKSGNTHITVTMDDKLNDLERIVFQLILGSDWRREAFSLTKLIAGEPTPTLFYEVK